MGVGEGRTHDVDLLGEVPRLRHGVGQRGNGHSPGAESPPRWPGTSPGCSPGTGARTLVRGAYDGRSRWPPPRLRGSVLPWRRWGWAGSGEVEGGAGRRRSGEARRGRGWTAARGGAGVGTGEWRPPAFIAGPRPCVRVRGRGGVGAPSRERAAREESMARLTGGSLAIDSPREPRPLGEDEAPSR